MIVGTAYTITMGEYSDKYLCTRKDPLGYELRRVQLWKSKIDAIRLPPTIFISHPVQTVNETKTKQHE